MMKPFFHRSLAAVAIVPYHGKQWSWALFTFQNMKDAQHMFLGMSLHRSDCAVVITKIAQTLCSLNLQIPS